MVVLNKQAVAALGWTPSIPDAKCSISLLSLILLTPSSNAFLIFGVSMIPAEISLIFDASSLKNNSDLLVFMTNESPGFVQNWPTPSVIEVAKPAADQASTPGVVTNDSTAKKSTTASTEKKCAKKSCCKKEASSSCDKDKSEGSACCKKKTDAATKKD